jgi:L-cysteine desulfidase
MTTFIVLDGTEQLKELRIVSDNLSFDNTDKNSPTLHKDERKIKIKSLLVRKLKTNLNVSQADNWFLIFRLFADIFQDFTLINSSYTNR